jgi:hypothetical protein
VIEHRDELPHEVGEDPAWSESYYFNFFDQAAGIGGFTRVGIRPNAGTADGNLFLFLADGRLAAVLNEADRTANGPPAVGTVSYECGEPLGRWRVRCRDTALVYADPASLGVPGEGGVTWVDLDLTFEAIMPPYGTSGRRVRTAAADATARVVAQGHFEQAGRIHGAVTVGAQTWTIDALGVRDKSWGPRDWSAPRGWRWFSMPFADDFALGVHTVLLPEREVQVGWMWRDGRTIKVSRFDLETKYEGPWHRWVHLRVSDDEGGVAYVEGEVLRVAPVTVGSTRIHEGMTRFRAGDRTTVGIAEYLDNPA